MISMDKFRLTCMRAGLYRYVSIQVNVFQRNARIQAYSRNVHAVRKQLNKILTAYDYLLILVDCVSRGSLLAIERGFLVCNTFT